MVSENAKLKFITLSFIFYNHGQLQFIPLITSVPKSGTFLLLKCLKLITKANVIINDHYNGSTSDLSIIALKEAYLTKSILVSHAEANVANISLMASPKIRIFFIYRDPRDQIVSAAYHIKKYPTMWPDQAKMDFKDLINYRINDINNFYKHWIPLMQNKFFFALKFEDLIGPKGGGSKLAQIRIIKQIAQRLSIKLSDKEIFDISENLFGDTDTFREGKIGSWKSHFTQEQKQLFKTTANKLLIDLGYEKDDKW